MWRPTRGSRASSSRTRGCARLLSPSPHPRRSRQYRRPRRHLHPSKRYRSPASRRAPRSGQYRRRPRSRGDTATDRGGTGAQRADAGPARGSTTAARGDPATDRGGAARGDTPPSPPHARQQRRPRRPCRRRAGAARGDTATDRGGTGAQRADAGPRSRPYRLPRSSPLLPRVRRPLRRYQPRAPTPAPLPVESPPEPALPAAAASEARPDDRSGSFIWPALEGRAGIGQPTWSRRRIGAALAILGAGVAAVVLILVLVLGGGESNIVKTNPPPRTEPKPSPGERSAFGASGSSLYLAAPTGHVDPPRPGDARGGDDNRGPRETSWHRRRR